MGTLLPALPVHPVFHEHQHQQQEGQALHSTLLTRYGAKKEVGCLFCVGEGEGGRKVDEVKGVCDETIVGYVTVWRQQTVKYSGPDKQTTVRGEREGVYLVRYILLC